MQVVAFNPTIQRSAPLTRDESELLELFRQSRDPEKVLRAACDAKREEHADRIWINVERLAQGPRRTFWQDLHGRSCLYDAVNAGRRDDDAPVTLTVDGENQYAIFAVRRGRYRVRVNGLPAWMRREWIRRVGPVVVGDAGGAR